MKPILLLAFFTVISVLALANSHGGYGSSDDTEVGGGSSHATSSAPSVSNAPDGSSFNQEQSTPPAPQGSSSESTTANASTSLSTLLSDTTSMTTASNTVVTSGESSSPPPQRPGATTTTITPDSSATSSEPGLGPKPSPISGSSQKSSSDRSGRSDLNSLSNGSPAAANSILLLSSKENSAALQFSSSPERAAAPGESASNPSLGSINDYGISSTASPGGNCPPCPVCTSTAVPPSSPSQSNCSLEKQPPFVLPPPAALKEDASVMSPTGSDASQTIVHANQDGSSQTMVQANQDGSSVSQSDSPLSVSSMFSHSPNSHSKLLPPVSGQGRSEFDYREEGPDSFSSSSGSYGKRRKRSPSPLLRAFS